MHRNKRVQTLASLWAEIHKPDKPPETVNEDKRVLADKLAAFLQTVARSSRMFTVIAGLDAVLVVGNKFWKFADANDRDLITTDLHPNLIFAVMLAKFSLLLGPNADYEHDVLQNDIRMAFTQKIDGADDVGVWLLQADDSFWSQFAYELRFYTRNYVLYFRSPIAANFGGTRALFTNAPSWDMVLANAMNAAGKSGTSAKTFKLAADRWILRKQPIATVDERKYAQREVRINEALSHTGITPTIIVHFVNEALLEHATVMEKFDGDMDVYFQTVETSGEKCDAQLFHQLAELLFKLALMGYCCVDVKPGNVVVNWTGNVVHKVRLIDFGSGYCKARKTAAAAYAVMLFLFSAHLSNERLFQPPSASMWFQHDPLRRYIVGALKHTSVQLVATTFRDVKLQFVWAHYTQGKLGEFETFVRGYRDATKAHVGLQFHSKRIAQQIRAAKSAYREKMELRPLQRDVRREHRQSTAKRDPARLVAIFWALQQGLSKSPIYNDEFKKRTTAENVDIWWSRALQTAFFHLRGEKVAIRELITPFADDAVVLCGSASAVLSTARALSSTHPNIWLIFARDKNTLVDKTLRKRYRITSFAPDDNILVWLLQQQFSKCVPELRAEWLDFVGRQNIPRTSF